MRILVACDSFKDALSAHDACRAIRAGLEKNRSGLAITQMPLSDGGEGLLEILGGPLGLRMIETMVCDPLGRPVAARFGLSADGGTAVVEMAEASGLQRLKPHERDILHSSTFGTGQLLAAARDRGARRCLLAIGGSATNDGGIGAAAALGWVFFDSAGQVVAPKGDQLARIVMLRPAPQPPFERLDVLCDVTNPLFGPNGATRVYGRQKGGTDQTIARLDAGLRHLAGLVEAQLGIVGLAEMPGAGAAGGIGFGAVAFLNGKLKRGVDIVLDLVGFDSAVTQCDLVITGEGHIDGQSAQGKLIQGVCARAAAAGVPVIALCGRLSATIEQIHRIGLRAAYSINATQRPLADMLAATAANLDHAAARLPL